ncbi:MAG TPA: aspartate carbamoyltransferase catalytic subunit [Planctomycetaceae bacterium]|nr:aspartate carbamoyltransferase catalytic subunit [Planctomycetaceae bacterium]
MLAGYVAAVRISREGYSGKLGESHLFDPRAGESLDETKGRDAKIVDTETTSSSRRVFPSFPDQWQRRHLLDLESLSAEELQIILQLSEEFKQQTSQGNQKFSLLKGRTCANIFFEDSTRTRNSFNLAARRLGADTIEFTASSSSVSKGETIIDTAKTIEAMNVDLLVVRHRTPGTPHLLSQNVDCSIINAGDGAHEHPTQGLLDILTIQQHRGDVAGLTVALVGDIAHSRTARSNIWGLQKLGAHVIVCGPSTLVSQEWETLGVEVAYNLDDILPRCDVLNLLRIQFERQYTRPFPSIREYALLYAMNRERMRSAKDDILIMAPGPINRGVEITPDVADGPHSVILDQVNNGLAVRMAVLWLLLHRDELTDPAQETDT